MYYDEMVRQSNSVEDDFDVLTNVAQQLLTWKYDSVRKNHTTPIDLCDTLRIGVCHDHARYWQALLKKMGYKSYCILVDGISGRRGIRLRHSMAYGIIDDTDFYADSLIGFSKGHNSHQSVSFVHGWKFKEIVQSYQRAYRFSSYKMYLYDATDMDYEMTFDEYADMATEKGRLIAMHKF